jgi:hypothetical protein
MVSRKMETPSHGLCNKRPHLRRLMVQQMKSSRTLHTHYVASSLVAASPTPQKRRWIYTALQRRHNLNDRTSCLRCENLKSILIRLRLFNDAVSKPAVAARKQRRMTRSVNCGWAQMREAAVMAWWGTRPIHAQKITTAASHSSACFFLWRI